MIHTVQRKKNIFIKLKIIKLIILEKFRNIPIEFLALREKKKVLDVFHNYESNSQWYVTVK